MLLWLEVKKNFLEINILNMKRVSIWKSENHLSWMFLSWIVPTVQESNCLNDTLLFTVCTFLSLSDFFLLSLLFLSSSTHFSPTQPFCCLPCHTSTRGPQQCPQATTRNIWHKKAAVYFPSGSYPCEGVGDFFCVFFFFWSGSRSCTRLFSWLFESW